MLERIATPELFYPFATVLHEKATHVEQQTLRWLDQMQLLETTKQRKKAEFARFGRLAARAYPYANDEGLQLASDWSAWLFVRDDKCDESGIGMDPLALHEHSELLMVALLCGHPLLDDHICDALLDLRQRMLSLKGFAWLTRFADSVQRYFEACVWEAQNRLTRSVPDVNTYMRMRRHTGGVLTCLEFIELTDDVRLPLWIRDNPQMQRIVEIANDAICWSNDVFSMEKELAQGDFHNLCLVLQHADKCSLQDAVDKAASLHNREIHEFIQLEASVVVDDPQTSQERDAKRFVAVLKAWMKGNYDWSIESGRYRPALDMGASGVEIPAANHSRIPWPTSV